MYKHIKTEDNGEYMKECYWVTSNESFYIATVCSKYILWGDNKMPIPIPVMKEIMQVSDSLKAIDEKNYNKN